MNEEARVALSINADDPKPQRSGHSKAPLTREEKAALKSFHVRKLLALTAAVETARGPFDEARNELTEQFAQAKADLGKDYSRKYLTGLIEDVKTSTRDLTKAEERRFEDRTDLALPVFGAQTDMFDGKGASMPDEAKDEVYWTTEGFRAGFRVEGNTPPKECPPRFHQAYMKGHEKGLIAAAEKFNQGEALSAALAAPPAEPEPEQKPEPEIDDQVEIKRQADALKKSGFAAKPAKTTEPVH
jgi:hypothetical protein